MEAVETNYMDVAYELCKNCKTGSMRFRTLGPPNSDYLDNAEANYLGAASKFAQSQTKEQQAGNLISQMFKLRGVRTSSFFLFVHTSMICPDLYEYGPRQLN